MSVTAKGEKIPQTVESLQDIMAKDADTMLDMDATIGNLRAKVNQLQQSRTKHLKELAELQAELAAIKEKALAAVNAPYEDILDMGLAQALRELGGLL